MKKLIKNSFLAIIVLLTLQACNDNEPELIFEDVPAVRLEKQAKELQDLLKSSTDGWKAIYFTDNTQLGGYSYLFKFTDNNTVEMASDFGGNDDVTSSQWALQTGATLKLSFTTKNKIHDLSEADNSPDADLIGQGYKGSFEFLYYGTDGDDIIFRTNRDFIELRFTKANTDDWSNISTHKDIWESFPGSNLAYKIGDKVSTFSYSNTRRFASNADSNSSTTGFGVGFTPTGIIISPAIDVEGTLYNEFILSDDKSKLVSLDGNFEIQFLIPPFNTAQNWNINVLGIGDVSDTFFNTFVAIFNENGSIWAETLSTDITFGNTTINGITTPGMLFNSFVNPATGAGFLAQYNLTFGGVPEDTSLLNITKDAGAFNWSFYVHLEPLIDLIADNAPYKAESTPLDDPTEVKLTSVSNPDVWFTLKR